MMALGQIYIVFNFNKSQTQLKLTSIIVSFYTNETLKTHFSLKRNKIPFLQSIKATIIQLWVCCGCPQNLIVFQRNLIGFLCLKRSLRKQKYFLRNLILKEKTFLQILFQYCQLSILCLKPQNYNFIEHQYRTFYIIIIYRRILDQKTMSSKPQLTKSQNIPGPGSYNIPTTMKVQIALSKQSNQKRFKPFETLAPGPGQYNTLSVNNINGPKALILSRIKQHKPQSIPGPGAYQPDYKKLMKSQSGYHLTKGQRLSPLGKVQEARPGPGTYETAKSTMVHNHNAIGFGPQRKIKVANENKVPGPGQYNTINTNSILHNDPKPVFSKSGRSQSYNTLTPGPGTYKASDNFEPNQKKGFSISFRTKSGQAFGKKISIPGPGSYHLDEIDKIKFKSSSFSVPKSPRLKMDNEKQILLVPGPQKYNIHLTAFEHKSFKLGSSRRKGMEKNETIPGPGAYEIKELKQMPKFSVPKANQSWIKASNVPGPGNYDPKISFNTQYQGIGINKDDRKPFYDEKKTIPGPGQYTITEMLNSKGGFKLGHEKRPDLTNSRENKPGPGDYNVKTKLKGEKNE